MSNQPNLTRRHFLRLGAGGVVVIGLGACASDGGNRSTPTAAGTAPSTTAVPSPAATVPPTPGVKAGRRLVIVQMNGGNDGLNMVVPSDGRYRDARPTLAIPEADLITLSGTTDVALHPSLAPLTAMWEAGTMAIVRGIGFADPNRSHFVAMDRWWRADQLDAPGWLGRVLDGLPADPSPLFATSLGSGAPLLTGATRQPTSISSPAGFTFNGLDAAAISALAAPLSVDPLTALAQRAFARTVAAVTDFATATASGDTDDDDEREGGSSLAAGLAVASRLLRDDVGTQIVVVSAAGFDTHSNQAATHDALLADLAVGISSFFEGAEAAGLDVLVATTSEFGRRVAENGSKGTDHGAGSSSFLFGAGVAGGLHGEIDLGNLLDGDVRPTVDPRTMYTACLDWIGADPTAVLGRRFDEITLLAS